MVEPWKELAALLLQQQTASQWKPWLWQGFWVGSNHKTTHRRRDKHGKENPDWLSEITVARIVADVTDPSTDIHFFTWSSKCQRNWKSTDVMEEGQVMDRGGHLQCYKRSWWKKELHWQLWISLVVEKEGAGVDTCLGEKWTIKSSRRMVSQHRTGVISYWTLKDVLKWRSGRQWVRPEFMDDASS